MKALSVKNGWSLMTLLIFFFLTLLYSGKLKGAEVPSVEDVITGKAEVPTIAELTGGKIKEGDF